VSLLLKFFLLTTMGALTRALVLTIHNLRRLEDMPLNMKNKNLYIKVELDVGGAKPHEEWTVFSEDSFRKTIVMLVSEKTSVFSILIYSRNKGVDECLGEMSFFLKGLWEQEDCKANFTKGSIIFSYHLVDILNAKLINDRLRSCEEATSVFKRRATFMEKEVAMLNGRIATLQSIIDDLTGHNISPTESEVQEDDHMNTWIQIGDQVGYAESSPEVERSPSKEAGREGREWLYDPQRWVTVSAFCHALERMSFVSEHKRINGTEISTRFHVQSVPIIPIAAYIKRIAWFTECSTTCFVLALEYIHRLARYRPQFEVNRYSLHQLAITAVMVSAKFFDDLYYKNSFYAEVGGVSAAAISGLEVQLMQFLSFDLFVLPEQYEARYRAMLTDNQGPSKVRIGPEGHWRDAVGGDWGNVSFDEDQDSFAESKAIDDVRDKIWHKVSMRTSKHVNVLDDHKKNVDGKRRLEDPLDSTLSRYERRATSTKAQWLGPNALRMKPNYGKVITDFKTFEPSPVD